MAIWPEDSVGYILEHVQKQIALKLRRQRRLGHGRQLRPASTSEQEEQSEDSDAQLQSNPICLKFSTTVHSRDVDSDATLDLDANDAYLGRMKNFSDLFQDPDLANGNLRITVRIDVSWASADERNDIIERLHQPAKPPGHLRIGQTRRQVDKSGEVSLEYVAMARLDEDKTRGSNSWERGILATIALEN